MTEHTTVLLHEAIEALVTDVNGVYVDATFGRGGHTRGLLKKLSDKGVVIAIDKDPEAVSMGREHFADDNRVTVLHGSFADISEFVGQLGGGKLAGILLDLGVSSPQLDQADRGFSFLRDGPLDMRMDTTQGMSAAQWLSEASETEITAVFKDYGEERFARRMASAIVRERVKKPIVSTLQLAAILSAAHPSWERGKHPATRAFQAIRIFINQELGDLESLLNQSIDLLGVGGRLVVISFHSLEDRRVKRFIRDQERGKLLPKHLPVPDVERGVKLKKVSKAVKPSKAEIAANVRSRSAVMRIAEKVA